MGGRKEIGATNSGTITVKKKKKSGGSREKDESTLKWSC